MIQTQPIVTLLTDFGTQDTYAAEVKAVLLRAGAVVVDLTHELPPFDVEAGCFHLMRAYSHFPKGTIHLAVVDPGVGTPRRAMLVEARNFTFVGPDNGLLKWAVEACERAEGAPARHFEISVAGDVGPTFHGRDLFAPTIVDYLAGTCSRLTMTGELRGRSLPSALRTDDGWEAEILAVDRYGNLVTSLAHNMAPRPKLTTPIGARVCNSYSEIPTGGVGLLRGSHGYWEIAAREKSAAAVTGIGRGSGLRFVEEPRS